MQNNNFMNLFLKRSKRDVESGYILAFTLIIISILLISSFSVSRIMTKEIYFSKLIELSKSSYAVADSGIECAKYLDSNFKDDILGISLILNSTSTSDGAYDFNTNASQNIFFSSSTVINKTGITSPSGIYCNSDDSTYNQIFGAYASTPKAVENNLDNNLSSYNITGDGTHATTTIGLIIKSEDPNTGDIVSQCALVVFSKERYSVATDTTAYFGIISTGYSSCNSKNRARVSRSIFEFSY
ncbi:MAG: hypothetical protein KBD12_01075 [Candidatus Pacebacteria bacterium]|nr:hypothetical protein [Candidatus Paceibacterota bacterium]